MAPQGLKTAPNARFQPLCRFHRLFSLIRPPLPQPYVSARFFSCSRLFPDNPALVQVLVSPHKGADWYRHNEIWRQTIAKGEGGEILSDRMLYANRVRVLYRPEP